MADASHLESLSRVDDVITPPAALRQAAYLRNLDETQRQSIEHNEAFWAKAAGELEWFRPWDQVFEWDYPRFRWFVGAQCNITANALDRHVNSWRKNKVAFVWVGEDGSEVTLSYGQLLRRVNRVAKALKSLGVGKGDRVVIDFAGRMDGTAFEGGTGGDVGVNIGAGTFLPGFEDQLVGMSGGETRVVKITFPENYANAQLAGKNAEFDVTVKSLEAPGKVTIDDAFAKLLGLESLDKLKDAVKGRLQQEPKYLNFPSYSLGSRTCRHLRTAA